MSERYENSDVSSRPILWSIAILIVSAVVIHVLLWFMFDYYRIANEKVDVRRSSRNIPVEVPREPRLETSTTAEFQEYARRQQELLSSYGWVSRSDGRVRIPIERAMEQLVEREGK
jgi:hypothetical protein